MKRSTLVLLVDSIAFISFLFLTSTGVLLHYLLPPGTGRWSAIWHLNRHEWGNIHFWISVIFFTVLSLHLILHWKVIVNLLKGRHSDEPKLRLVLGIVGLLVILLLSSAPLVSPTSETEKNSGHQYRRGIAN